MKRGRVWVVSTLIASAAPIGGALAQTVSAGPAPAGQVVGYSSQNGTLAFHLADGSTVRVALRGGDVLVNDERVGRYAEGGRLPAAWEALVARAADLGTDEMLMALKELRLEGATTDDAAALRALRQPLAGLAPVEGDVVAPGVAPVPAVPTVPDADALRASAQEMRDAIRESVREAVRDVPRTTVRQVIRGNGASSFANPGSSIPEGLLALLGTFAALAGLGFGLSYFGERQLDIVADTASASIARSFFVGLFAQPLIIPAFGMLIVGLVLTVIGILVIPFAAVGFLAVLAAMAVGGYIAVARAMGEAFARKRGMDVASGGFGTFRRTAIGLSILLSLWLPAVIFGWVPVAGTILTGTAMLATWAAVTTGFGAAILTRGGLRGTFGRRFRAQAVAELAWPSPEPEVERFDTGEWLGRKTER